MVPQESPYFQSPLGHEFPVDNSGRVARHVFCDCFFGVVSSDTMKTISKGLVLMGAGGEGW